MIALLGIVVAFIMYMAWDHSNTSRLENEIQELSKKAEAQPEVVYEQPIIYPALQVISDYDYPLYGYGRNPYINNYDYHYQRSMYHTPYNRYHSGYNVPHNIPHGSMSYNTPHNVPHSVPHGGSIPHGGYNPPMKMPRYYH
jgi:hypothetical protein